MHKNLPKSITAMYWISAQLSFELYAAAYCAYLTKLPFLQNLFPPKSLGWLKKIYIGFWWQGFSDQICPLLFLWKVNEIFTTLIHNMAF